MTQMWPQGVRTARIFIATVSPRGGPATPTLLNIFKQLRSARGQAEGNRWNELVWRRTEVRIGGEMAEDAEELTEAEE